MLVTLAINWTILISPLLSSYRSDGDAIKPRVLYAKPETVRALVFSPNGRILGISDARRGVELLEMASKKVFLRMPTRRYSPIAFSKTGSYLAFGDQVYDQESKEWRGRVRCIDVISKKELPSLDNALNSVRHLAFINNKTLVLLSSTHAPSFDEPNAEFFQQIEFWEVGTTKRKLFQRGRFDWLALTPNGHELATFDTSKSAATRFGMDLQPFSFVLFDIVSGQKKVSLDCPTVAAFAESEDRRRGVSCGYGRDRHHVIVWDLAKGTKSTLIDGKWAQIPALAISADGKHVAIGQSSGKVVILDIASREQVGAVQHAKAVWEMTFSPSGDRLVTANEDATINEWDLSRFLRQGVTK
jgi:WD40 repeat protein